MQALPFPCQWVHLAHASSPSLLWVSRMPSVDLSRSRPDAGLAAVLAVIAPAFRLRHAVPPWPSRKQSCAGEPSPNVVLSQ